MKMSVDEGMWEGMKSFMYTCIEKMKEIQKCNHPYGLQIKCVYLERGQFLQVPLSSELKYLRRYSFTLCRNSSETLKSSTGITGIFISPSNPNIDKIAVSYRSISQEHRQVVVGDSLMQAHLDQNELRFVGQVYLCS